MAGSSHSLSLAADVGRTRASGERLPPVPSLIADWATNEYGTYRDAIRGIDFAVRNKELLSIDVLQNLVQRLI